ncbi:dTDP-4-dehydrorhamnose reductase [Nitrosopumilus zosterae]|uniref:dTDP-4-dehydrorhamnose reductase n=1 Tax=Nitrosopumilus zosterae TaxID=718286 RepID=UPI0021F1A8AE|nr:dTDP-4-dehydrorhamnose reductase [Nitrosopumilus zosterae]BDQ31816.1 dTDP-4-dehydrorhamnose reductase [Nitrosopumilus zosterae]
MTGSTGLVGRQVVRDLVRKNYEVYACYNRIKPEFGIPVNLDLSKTDKIISVLHSINPNIIIHLAAITDLEKCEIQREQAVLINTDSTRILARESTKLGAFFIYVSTDYVFDGTEGYRKEDDITNPLNIYGKSKLDGEIAIRDSTSKYAIIRTSTPFGLHSTKKSFPLWIKENLEGGKETSVLIDQFTSPTYVPNLSKMIIEVTLKQIIGIIHLAGATRISRYEFAIMIAEKLDLDKSLLKPIKIQDMNWKATRPKDSSLDISKAKKILMNKPEEIEYALENFIYEIKNLKN